MSPAHECSLLDLHLSDDGKRLICPHGGTHELDQEGVLTNARTGEKVTVRFGTPVPQPASPIKYTRPESA